MPEPRVQEVARPLSFGVYEFDPESLELKRAGIPVRLQELPARLLCALVRHPGELVTREHLRTELWKSNTFVQFDAGLNTAMNKLRLALRDSADNPQFVETVPRTGYRFIAPVRALHPPQIAPELFPKPRPKIPKRLLVGAAVVVAALAALVLFLRNPRPGPPVHFAIDLPSGQDFRFYSGRQVAVSPDGGTIAWIAVTRSVRQIYVRKLKEAQFHAVPGTAGASGLCFSPDGAWVAYISQAGDLGKASVDGRWNLKLLTLGPRSIDGTLLWGLDGWIYFSATDYPLVADSGVAKDTRGIYRIRVGGGGQPEPVLPVPQPTGISYPLQLLDRGLLYTSNYAPSDIAVSLLSASDHKVRQLVGHASGGRYVAGGYLVFDQLGNIMAAPFDAGRMEVTGKPVVAVRDVAPDRYAGLQMDVSETGTLVYFRSPLVHPRQPVWVDQEGHESPSGLPVGRYRLLDLSPDGSRLLVTRFDAGEHWTIYSLTLASLTSANQEWKEILSGESPGTGAIWSPDGNSIVITARYQGERMDTLYLKPLDAAAGGERPLLSDAYSGKYAQSWSRAANAIAYTEGYHEKTKRDIYVLSLAPGAQPQCIACTVEDDVFPSFSPDGRWIAYTSGVSGRFEVYAQRYPGASSPVRVSRDGGQNSLWAPSGRELYYELRHDMWAVAFDPASGKAGQARRLFAGNYDAGSSFWNRDMSISPDGKRFLMLKTIPDPPDYRRIQVVENWFEELRRGY